MNTILGRRLAAPAMIALSLTLAACGETSAPNRGMESAHQPVVNRIDYALDVRGGGNGGLAQGEARRLQDWFDSLRLGYGDRVAVEDRNAYGNVAICDDIAAAAARYGLLLNESAPVTAGAVADGMVRVVVSRMTASVPNCPDWSRVSQPDYTGATSSNYGCAVNTNLAAMIANPEDLIEGRSDGGGVDGQLSAKAIKTFRDKVPTGAAALQTNSTKKGE